MVPVYLVRHACAGDKQLWGGPDIDRPLDPDGVQQAQALADNLATTPVHRILTSPARQCVETVEPLARRIDLPVEEVPELLPDGDNDGDRLGRLVVALHASTPVICTYGELMRPFLAALRTAGVRITAQRHDDDWLLAKGAVWALTVDANGSIAGAHHHPARPPMVCAHDLTHGDATVTAPAVDP